MHRLVSNLWRQEVANHNCTWLIHRKRPKSKKIALTYLIFSIQHELRRISSRTVITSRSAKINFFQCNDKKQLQNAYLHWKKNTNSKIIQICKLFDDKTSLFKAISQNSAVFNSETLHCAHPFWNPFRKLDCLWQNRTVWHALMLPMGPLLSLLR